MFFFILFFFYNQKTAYEMFGSDWSSDVCSSDLANHSKMDLSIRGHRGFKDASPINVPTGEGRACITCDGEEKCHGILADFEIATVLRSSRVALCFSFRHSWKHPAQISKRPTVINPQSQTQ